MELRRRWDKFIRLVSKNQKVKVEDSVISLFMNSFSHAANVRK